MNTKEYIQLSNIRRTKKALIRETRRVKRYTKAKVRREKRKKQSSFIVNRSNYYEYLKTARWKRTKNNFLRDNPECYICGTRLNRQVHHKTYERVGYEDKSDLLCLCRECHKVVHIFLHCNKCRGVTLWNVASKVKSLIDAEQGLDVFAQAFQFLRVKKTTAFGIHLV